MELGKTAYRGQRVEEMEGKGNRRRRRKRGWRGRIEAAVFKWTSQQRDLISNDQLSPHIVISLLLNSFWPRLQKPGSLFVSLMDGECASPLVHSSV